MNRKILPAILKILAMAIAIIAAAITAQWIFNWRYFQRGHAFQVDGPIPRDIRLKDGSTYCGSLWQGVPDGNGVLSFPDGGARAGRWKQGCETGLFREVNKYGETVFTMWVNGSRIGYASLSCDTSAYYGIDVSRYQDACWGATCIAMSENGKRFANQETGLWRPVEFVYMKATEGVTIYDPLYRHHLKMARRLKLPRGAYHVMQVNVPARDQALHFLSCISPSDCNMPPVLDLEAQYFKQTLTLPDIRSSLLTWLQIVENELGQRPLIYTGRQFYQNYLEGTELDDYGIWLADYSGRPDREDIFMRQVTSKGVLSGWNASVDVDKLYKWSFTIPK